MRTETPTEREQTEAALAAWSGKTHQNGRGRAALWAGVWLARAASRSGWRTLAAIAVGMLVAVVFLATVPLFADLAANIQIQATINRQGAASRNIEIQATSLAVGDNPFIPGRPGATSASFLHQEDTTVRATAHQYLGPLLQPNPTHYLTADPMGLTQLGPRNLDIQSPTDPRAQFWAFDYTQAGPSMRLVAGRFPQPTSDGVPEALITQQMAANEGAHVGDLFTAQQLASYLFASGFSYSVRIVGIWEPRDPTDAFWNGHSFISVPSCDFCPFIYPVLLDQQAFESGLTGVDNLGIIATWDFASIPTHITTANLADTIVRVKQFRTALSNSLLGIESNSVVATDLDRALGDAQAQLALLGLPLYIVVAQIVGLALLFVATMADLLAQTQAGAIATLKSRGASGAQFFAGYIAQGLALALPLALAGPWLASLLALGLVRAFVPANTLAQAHVSLDFLSRLAQPRAAILPAALGGLLGIGAIVSAAQRASARDTLAFRREQGRAGRPPLWRRLYADVWLAVICVAGFVELNQFGGTHTRQQVGLGSGSLLLAAAPGLLLLAGALLLLRTFPLAMALGARLAARGRGAASMLSFAQVARAAAGPGRLTLLLALVVGLGLFALTYDASLARNAADQAAYQAGADIRLVEQSAVAGLGDVKTQAELAALPGVRGVAAALRIQTNLVTVTVAAQSSGPRISVLGVDPNTWSPVAAATSWRADYASATPAALMARFSAHQWGTDAADRSGQSGAGDANHPIWAIVSANLAQSQGLRLGDRFHATLPGAYTNATLFVVSAVVAAFPTLYPGDPAGGFVVANLNDLLGASTVYEVGKPGTSGPNEYWLRVTPDPTPRAALLRTLEQRRTDLGIQTIVDQQALHATISGNPLRVTISGLLLSGAALAAALALLGSLIQATSSARLRGMQFAVLRTLGMGRGQLARMLLGELLVVYLYGLLGGTLLGIVLSAATLPYLQFSDTRVNAGTLGVPPYTLTIDPITLALFYAVLAGALALALALVARYAARVELGRGLRIGED